MNYYPFHIGDYASATRHLSWDEDGAYRRLLDVYYTSEKPVPVDHRAACRLVMAQTDSQREAVKVVLAEFFELTDAGWVNKRADAEIDEMRIRQQKQRDKANKRWHTQAPAPGIAPAMPQHSSDDAAASANDAGAMPPTPTPTPTPKNKKKAAPELSVDVLCADGLTEQTAIEFIALRNRKGARLTSRAWQGIKAEADKAAWPVERAVCKSLSRGWTGFEADWVADNRPRVNGNHAEPEWRTEQRERVIAFAGPAAAKARQTTIDMEAPHGAAKLLG